MNAKMIELLKLFKIRAVRASSERDRETFSLVSLELELAMSDSEPPNLIAHIPPSCIHLVEVALHFNQDSEDCWRDLGEAALNVQSGPS